MKSLFDNKEASLREEIGEEREKLKCEVAVLRQRLEEAEAGRAAAEVRARVRIESSLIWGVLELPCSPSSSTVFSSFDLL